MTPEERFSFDDFTDLASLQATGTTPPSNVGPPSEQQWEDINNFRYYMDRQYETIPDDALILHDKAVTWYRSEFIRLGIDPTNSHTILTMLKTVAMMDYLLSHEVATCTPQIVPHIMEHISTALMGVGFCLRDACNALSDAPPVHVPLPGTMGEDAE
jgi:hypothetical protein